MTKQTETLVHLYGKPIVQRVTPIGDNVVSLHPPMAQHRWTRPTVINDQLHAHHVSQAFNSFVKTVFVICAVVAAIGWIWS